MVIFMCTWWRVRRAHSKRHRVLPGPVWSCYSDHHVFAHFLPSTRKVLSLHQATPSSPLPGCISFTTFSSFKAENPMPISSRKPHVVSIRSCSSEPAPDISFFSIMAIIPFFFPFCIVFLNVCPQTSSHVSWQCEHSMKAEWVSTHVNTWISEGRFCLFWTWSICLCDSLPSAPGLGSLTGALLPPHVHSISDYLLSQTNRLNLIKHDKGSVPHK